MRGTAAVAKGAHDPETDEVRIAREYKTVSQIANLFPVGEKRLYDAIADGSLRHVKKGRNFLIRIQAVDDWLKAQEEGGTPTE